MRALAGEGWALMQDGRRRARRSSCSRRARELAEGPQFSDVDRADVLFRLGVCRYKLASIATAIALFDEALELAERSGLPCDLLRADILGWRSRCRRRQRDFEAAREDVERALELAQAMDDRRVVANTYFQASLVAERMGHWVAVAQLRAAGEGALRGAERRAERRPPDAEPRRPQPPARQARSRRSITSRRRSRSASRPESQPDAAQALGSLATVHLHLERATTQADEHARKALELLEGREDFLRRGRPVAARARPRRCSSGAGSTRRRSASAAADAAFEQLASVSHRAGAWVALGDLASRRGDDREAARLYRNAAEALQDIRF